MISHVCSFTTSHSCRCHLLSISKCFIVIDIAERYKQEDQHIKLVTQVSLNHRFHINLFALLMNDIGMEKYHVENVDDLSKNP